MPSPVTKASCSYITYTYTVNIHRLGSHTGVNKYSSLLTRDSIWFVNLYGSDELGDTFFMVVQEE